MKILKKLVFLAFISISALTFISCPPEPPGDVDQDSQNSPPTGSAGAGKTILVGETVSFDEAAASDADTGDTLSFQWSITSKPAGSTAAVSDATSLNASFTPDEGGEYTLQLKVSDGTETFTAAVTVRAVSFAIGLNSNSGNGSAYIYNDSFNSLSAPP